MPAINNPGAATTALRKRADAVAPGMFEADLRQLKFLAREWEKARAEAEAGGGSSSGILRDLMREFGLQLRATSSAVRDEEEKALNRLVEIDWKAEMELAVAEQGPPQEVLVSEPDTGGGGGGRVVPVVPAEPGKEQV